MQDHPITPAAGNPRGVQDERSHEQDVSGFGGADDLVRPAPLVGDPAGGEDPVAVAARLQSQAYGTLAPCYLPLLMNSDSK